MAEDGDDDFSCENSTNNSDEDGYGNSGIIDASWEDPSNMEYGPSTIFKQITVNRKIVDTSGSPYHIQRNVWDHKFQCIKCGKFGDIKTAYSDINDVIRIVGRFTRCECGSKNIKWIL